MRANERKKSPQNHVLEKSLPEIKRNDSSLSPGKQYLHTNEDKLRSSIVISKSNSIPDSAGDLSQNKLELLTSQAKDPSPELNIQSTYNQRELLFSPNLFGNQDVHRQTIKSILAKLMDLQGLREAFEKYQPRDKSISIEVLKGSPNTTLKKYKDCAYYGEMLNSNRHGIGIMIYADTRVYEGNWAKNLKEGNGLEILPNGNTYEGQFRNGKPEGFGIFIWSNGETYEGEWKEGLKHGTGSWKGINGESYTGDWKNGQADGMGIHIWINGDKYEGEIKGFLKHGYGKETFSNGDFYIGNFLSGKPEGTGEYHWANGCHFKGMFKAGLRHGKGTWKKAPGKSDFYEGEWENDKKSGQGIYTWASGNYYKGLYLDDMRHGYGEMWWTDGSYYKGNWEKGQQHGDGEMMLSNKQIKRGTFQNNAFIDPEPTKTKPTSLIKKNQGPSESLPSIFSTRETTEIEEFLKKKTKLRVIDRSKAQGSITKFLSGSTTSTEKQKQEADNLKRGITRFTPKSNQNLQISRSVNKSESWNLANELLSPGLNSPERRKILRGKTELNSSKALGSTKEYYSFG